VGHPLNTWLGTPPCFELALARIFFLVGDTELRCAKLFPVGQLDRRRRRGGMVTEQTRPASNRLVGDPINVFSGCCPCLSPTDARISGQARQKKVSWCDQNWKGLCGQSWNNALGILSSD